MENFMESHGISWNSMKYFMKFHGKNFMEKSVKCLWKISWNSMVEFHEISHGIP
jgi:hypothetical protein